MVPRRDVVFRHVSRDGVPTGAGLQVSGTSYTYGHTIASDGQGGALIAWIGEGTIYVQRIAASETPLWTPGGVPVTSDTAHIALENAPLLASDGQGGAYVAWVESRDEFGITVPRVYLQRVGSNGVIQWGAGRPPGGRRAMGDEEPCLSTSDTEGAIVAGRICATAIPTSMCRSSSRSGAAAYSWPNDYDHGPESQGVRVVGEPGSAQTKPRIASDGAGGASIVWEDVRNGNLDLYAQRLTRLGVVAWAASGRAVTTAVEEQQEATLAPFRRRPGRFSVVAWRDFRNPADADVFAQRIDVGGRILWQADGVALCRATGEPTNVAAVSDGSGGVIVSWTDT